MEPLVAAVWSCDPATSLDYPARYLFTFLEHHGMLGVFGSPEWRTVTGGSGTYVAAVAEHLPEIRLGTKVTSVRETTDGVEVTDGNGETSSYDAVVVATHPAQALSMLEDPTPLQREVLGAMPYSPNTALLHTDTSLLPAAEGARSSWNFQRPLDATGAVTVTYDLTRLQRLPTDTHYLVTLGGEHLVDPATVIDRMEYEHPLYTPASVAAQGRLPEIDTDRLAFAGAYHGWGFHEDGARSGLAAATRLGLEWVRPEKAAPVRPGRFETTIRHTRRTPIQRSFEHRSTFWLVDLDDLPDHGRLARFEARDHLGDPDATCAPTSRASSATTASRWAPAPASGRDPDGRAPAVAGPLLQPDQRVLVLRRRGRPGGRRGRGAQHLRRPARLPRPPRRPGPRPHRQGDVRLALPRRRRLVRHRRAGPDRPARTSPSRCAATTPPTATPPPSAPRSPAPAATCRSAAPWARPCAGACSSASTASGCGRAACPSVPVRPTTRKVSDDARQRARHRRATQARAAADSLPSLEPLRPGPRTAISAAVARKLFRAAVRRLAVTRRRGAHRADLRPGRSGHARSTAPTSSTRGSAATA